MKQAYVTKRLSRKRREMIERIDAIASEYTSKGIKITLRQCFYQLVSRSLIENSETSYKKVSDLVSDGRMNGLLDWDTFEDRTRYERSNTHWKSPQEILESAIHSYTIDTRVTQPYRLEAWIEKDSLIAIVEDIASRHDVTCFSCRGYPSVTSLHEAAMRIKADGRPCIILYAGDHDPTGLRIPQIISEQLNIFGVCVNLERIGLTLDQVRELNLPPNRAKESDGNFRWYVENTGLETSWELDGLPPERLASIYEEAILRYTDLEQIAKMKEIENRDLYQLRRLIA